MPRTVGVIMSSLTGVRGIIRRWMIMMLTPADARWPNTVSVTWHYLGLASSSNGLASS